MFSNAFKCLHKTSLKIKLNNDHPSKQIHYLGHLVRRNSIFPLTDKIEALMKLKPPTNIKEVRHSEIYM